MSAEVREKHPTPSVAPENLTTLTLTTTNTREPEQSTSANEAKNTDGWDTLRSDNIVIQSSTIQNNDDCVSFKPNSTNILVQNLMCGNSRGISVGSLGQYPGQYDIVENVYVYNTLMGNASAGARIKVWPSGHVNFQAALSGGGGSGYVKNVTFDSYHNVNNDWAIEVNQCYGTRDLKFCHENPVSKAETKKKKKKMTLTTN